MIWSREDGTELEVHQFAGSELAVRAKRAVPPSGGTAHRDVRAKSSRPLKLDAFQSSWIPRSSRGMTCFGKPVSCPTLEAVFSGSSQGMLEPNPRFAKVQGQHFCTARSVASEDGHRPSVEVRARDGPHAILSPTEAGRFPEFLDPAVEPRDDDTVKTTTAPRHAAARPRHPVRIESRMPPNPAIRHRDMPVPGAPGAQSGLSRGVTVR